MERDGVTVICSASKAGFFAQLTAELLDAPDKETTFDRLVQASVDLFPGVHDASLTVPDRRGAHTLASTSDIASRCDTWQYELGEGPCVAALSEDEWYRSGDVARDPRWPRWGPRAAAVGVMSLVSVRLAIHDHPIGALNLYSRSANQFDDDSLDLVFLYAVHAAGALSAARQITGLLAGLQNRHTIGVAQGILMQRYELSLERSFNLLRRYSTSQNLKLRDVAAYVVEHRKLPEPRTPSTILGSPGE